MSYHRSSIAEAPEDLRSNGSVIYKMRRQMKKIKAMTI